jgi:DNA-binding protein H-NS
MIAALSGSRVENLPGMPNWMKVDMMDASSEKEELNMALKTMPIPKLQELARQVEGAIAEKVTERRRELESELSKLARFDGGGRGVKVGRGGGPRGSVAPKYRNPENTTDTWAGRGLKPRWLVAAIKGGKSLDDFLIAGASKAASAKQPKVRKKARK